MKKILCFAMIFISLNSFGFIYNNINDGKHYFPSGVFCATITYQQGDENRDFPGVYIYVTPIYPNPYIAPPDDKSIKMYSWLYVNKRLAYHKEIYVPTFNPNNKNQTTILFDYHNKSQFDYLWSLIKNEGEKINEVMICANNAGNENDCDSNYYIEMKNNPN